MASKFFSKKITWGFFLLGLLGVSFFWGAFFAISASKKIDFDRGLSSALNRNYSVSEQQFKYVYNEYSSNTGKDEYQKISVIALGFLRSKHIHQKKIDNVYQEIDKLYPPEIARQLKKMLEDYKKQLPVVVSNIKGMRKKEKELLTKVTEVFQSIP